MAIWLTPFPLNCTRGLRMTPFGRRNGRQTSPRRVNSLDDYENEKKNDNIWFGHCVQFDVISET